MVPLLKKNLTAKKRKYYQINKDFIYIMEYRLENAPQLMIA